MTHSFQWASVIHNATVSKVRSATCWATVIFLVLLRLLPAPPQLQKVNWTQFGVTRSATLRIGTVEHQRLCEAVTIAKASRFTPKSKQYYTAKWEAELAAIYSQTPSQSQSPTVGSSQIAPVAPGTVRLAAYEHSSLQSDSNASLDEQWSAYWKTRRAFATSVVERFDRYSDQVNPLATATFTETVTGKRAPYTIFIALLVSVVAFQIAWWNVTRRQIRISIQSRNVAVLPRSWFSMSPLANFRALLSDRRTVAEGIGWCCCLTLVLL